MRPSAARAAPPSATWIAAIHTSAEDFEPRGTAVVVDDRRVLTSAHVVKVDGSEVWVAFPMSGDPATPRRRAVQVRPAAHPRADLAVVELEEPIPAGVDAARLRCPKPAALVSRAWWAFGFAGHDPEGNEAAGTVGALLANGWPDFRSW